MFRSMKNGLISEVPELQYFDVALQLKWVLLFDCSLSIGLKNDTPRLTKEP